MKKLVSFFAIALLAATVAKAQTSGAVQVGSMSVTIPASSVEIETPTLTTTTKKSYIISEVLILRTSVGQYEYLMKSSGIRLVDDDGTITDGIATNDIITSLAKAAVAQAYLYGFIDDGSNSKVWSENCIIRSGSGEYTRFKPCSSNTQTGFRDLKVSESAGTTEPVVTLEGYGPNGPGTSYTVPGSFE